VIIGGNIRKNIDANLKRLLGEGGCEAKTLMDTTVKKKGARLESSSTSAPGRLGGKKKRNLASDSVYWLRSSNDLKDRDNHCFHIDG